MQAPPAEDGRSNHQFPRHGSQVWDGHVVPRVENGNLDEFVPVFAPPLVSRSNEYYLNFVIRILLQHHYPPEPNQPTEYTIPPASSIHYSNVVIELEESLQQESREIQLRARYEETGSGFLCLECRTIIQREKDMVRHLEKTAKHGVRGFPCTECERSYTRAETLRDHKCKAKKL